MEEFCLSLLHLLLFFSLVSKVLDRGTRSGTGQQTRKVLEHHRRVGRNPSQPLRLHQLSGGLVMYGGGNDEHRPLHLLNGVHVVLYERVGQGLVKAMGGGQNNV